MNKIGIDVSEHNGKLNWKKLKSDVGFTIIRCGYGSDYKNQDDKQFNNNIKGCAKNSIPYGIYLYSYADTVDKAKSEAQHTLRLIKGLNPYLPVYYDVEETKQYKLGKAKLKEIISTYCNIISKAGYRVGIYASTSWWNSVLADSFYDKYYKWVAQWSSKCTYKGEYSCWQFTNAFKVGEGGGKFDANILTKPIILGDVNGDYSLTNDDVELILKAAAKIESVNDIIADLNKDGKITTKDAKILLDFLKGES